MTQMPSEVRHSPPPHRPGDVTARPKGILKNPSFSGPSGHGDSHASDNDDITSYPPSAPLDPQEAKDLTIQNTLQNAGHRRSSSAARKTAASRRHSSSAQAAGNNSNSDDDPEKQRLKWDEANLYLAEQESGGRMKITEPKTPYQYGDAMEEDDVQDDDDVAIDPRFVNVDEVDMVKEKRNKSKENDIPGLDIGEAEDASSSKVENERIIRGESLLRENSRDKHVSVSGESGGHEEKVGMPTREEQEKHKQFEEQRKKHYEMRSVKGMLGHPEDMDEMDEDDADTMKSSKALPNRGVNGAS